VDDVHFIKTLVAQLRQEFAIGEVFLTGVSNGGMFTHYLASRAPHLARAVIPIYGLPLARKLRVPPALGEVAIMQIHDRGDKTIPWQGGMTSDGWIYESTSTVLGVWAQRHGCKATNSQKLKSVITPFSGGPKNMECHEYRKCKGGRVILCLYDGQHGSWPAKIEDLSWWFLSQSINSSLTM
jgi:poly(3-hydroxybutyrate) depolymerase